MLKKRGQEGASGAAALVALIALFILLFIVFLPPSERAKLLDDTVDPLDVNNSSNRINTSRTFLLENPGSLIPPDQTTLNYPIAPQEVSQKLQAKEIERERSIIVKRTLLSKQEQNVTFHVDNPELLSNALMNFKVLTGSGVITIIFNGRTLLNQELPEGNIIPISLPVETLKKDNVLEIYAEKVGAAFWSINKYELSDFVITADVTDLSNSIAESTFYVPPSDIERLMSSKLFFMPACSKDRGKLTILLNGENIFSGKPVCDVVAGVEFSPQTTLLPGNNKIRFKTDSGSYSLTRIRVSSQPKEPETYLYYFKISPELFDDVYVGNENIIASLKFSTAGQSKEGKIVINGFKRSFDVREAGYAIDISDFIEDGFNSIEIIPVDPLQVVELRVELE